MEIIVVKIKPLGSPLPNLLIDKFARGKNSNRSKPRSDCLPRESSVTEIAIAQHVIPGEVAGKIIRYEQSSETSPAPLICSHRLLCKAAFSCPRAQSSSGSVVGLGVIEEMNGIVRCLDGLEGQWRLRKVETIGKVVGARICIPQRRERKDPFSELQDAAEVMRHMRDVACLCEWGNHDQRHAEAVFVGVVPFVQPTCFSSRLASGGKCSRSAQKPASERAVRVMSFRRSIPTLPPRSG
jgi:hypothetical protein